MGRIQKTLKTVSTLGIIPSVQNLIYRGFLKAGFYRTILPVSKIEDEKGCGDFIPLPMPERVEILPYLEADADRVRRDGAEIISGNFHPFMGENIQKIDFLPVNGTRHWSSAGRFIPEDIKLIWEPARFCWADALMRLEWLDHDGRAEAAFRRLLDDFLERNPVNAGENWESAQEVALRLINLVLCSGAMMKIMEYPCETMSSPERERIRADYSRRMAQIIQAHARRIPPTLIYAKSQRNNHLISEAVGLMTAAAVLPQAKDADKWWKLGKKTLFAGLKDQIFQDGCYIQQSTNYHRLVLQLITFADRLLQFRNESWPEKMLPKLRRTVRYLAQYVDPTSGSAWNLGHNDGALLFAFGTSYADYRPTVFAASKIFLAEPYPIDDKSAEYALWLGVQKNDLPEEEETLSIMDHTSLRIGDEKSHAGLHAVHWFGRPAHDDQLQADIRFDGINEVMDAGTYRYSGTEAWENSLKSAFVHNAPVIDGSENMTDAGKFLWLDWDHVRPLIHEENTISAEEISRLMPGVRKTRTIERTEAGFCITDRIDGSDDREHEVRINWLVPDQKFEWKNGTLQLERINLHPESGLPYGLKIIRAGEAVFKTDKTAALLPEEQYCGCISRTYDEKEPALSVILTWKSPFPFEVKTTFERKA